MNEHDKQQEQFFDKFSSVFDNDEIADLNTIKEIECFLSFADLPKNTNLNVLEIGAGSGRYTLYLLQKGYHVTATDVSQKSLDVLTKKAEKFGLQNNLTTVNNSLDEPIFKNEFDFVFCVNLLHHVNCIPNMFTNMCAALKTDGKICILEPNPYNPLFYIYFLIKHSWAVEKGILKCTKSKLLKNFNNNNLNDVTYQPYVFLPSDFSKLLTMRVYDLVNDKLVNAPFFRNFCCFHFIKGTRR